MLQYHKRSTYYVFSALCWPHPNVEMFYLHDAWDRDHKPMPPHHQHYLDTDPASRSYPTNHHDRLVSNGLMFDKN